LDTVYGTFTYFNASVDDDKYKQDAANIYKSLLEDVVEKRREI
jgi:CelD/BcsL family acetyltransferase involved in cellulose biosynthesis